MNLALILKIFVWIRETKCIVIVYRSMYLPEVLSISDLKIIGDNSFEQSERTMVITEVNDAFVGFPSCHELLELQTIYLVGYSSQILYVDNPFFTSNLNSHFLYKIKKF